MWQQTGTESFWFTLNNGYCEPLYVLLRILGCHRGPWEEGHFWVNYWWKHPVFMTICRVFSEWLIPEPCEPFLPIPELQRNVMVIARGPRSRELVNLFSFKCLDTAKRSPKFLRQPIRGQLNSFRVGKSDLFEGNGQAPLDQCGQSWVDIFLNTRSNKHCEILVSCSD